MRSLSDKQRWFCVVCQKDFFDKEVGEMLMKIKSLKYYICLVITTIFILGSHFLPAFGKVTEYGMTVLGIFFGLIFGFATVGLISSSFLAMISLGLTQYGSVSVVIKDAIGNNIILFTIGVLILSATLEETGVTKKMVYMLAANKIIIGRPWMLTFIFFLIAYVASFFLNVIIPSLLLWSLISELCSQAGYKVGDKWPAVMYFGIVYVATAASFVLPFQIGVIANFGMLEVVSKGTIMYETIPYIFWATVCSILISMSYWFFVRYIVKPDVEPLKKISLEKDDVFKFTSAQIYSIALFFSLIILLVGSSIIPGDTVLANIISKLETSGLTLGMIIIALCIRYKNNPVFNFSTLFSKGMAWDIILMLSTIFLMATILTDPSTGITQMVQELCSPIVEKMPSIAFLIVVTFIIALISNVTMNAAVSCTMIPVVYMLVGAEKFNLVLLVAMINFIGGMAFLLPCSSGSSALLYGRTEWISRTEIHRYSVFAFIVTYVIIVLIGLPLGNILFK